MLLVMMIIMKTPHDIDLSRISKHNFELNSEITEEEVLKCLTKLKLNKACSSDLILNEFLKFSKTKILTAFTELFNLIFSSGLIPDEWSQGIISPIYKNKRDKQILTIIGHHQFEQLW